MARWCGLDKIDRIVYNIGIDKEIGKFPTI